ncbi:transposase [Colwellia sp. MB3u-70]|uniref:transposase n=1 Tax=unclassified Colwellia TaxID=196834 RepID=UPI0015F76B56|nr:transposase [Colwellia sp. MB3u-70]
MPVCSKLTALPGVAWIIASTLYARLGDGSAYKCGRDASASVGVVPAHSRTGGNNKLLGITKRSDRCLRSLLDQVRLLWLLITSHHGALVSL